MKLKRKQSKKSQNKNELTISEHLKELKCRCIFCIIMFVVVFIIMYCNSKEIMELVMQCGLDAGLTFGYLSPQESLLQVIGTTGVLSLLLVSPVIIWQVLAFISPIMGTKRGKIILVSSAIVAELLFCVGIVFCLNVLFPFVFKYLHEYSMGFELKELISISSYVSLFLTLSIVIGVIFEMPLFSAILSVCKILNPSTMLKALKPAIIIIAIVSAIITPPDIVSMMMVGIPMLGIYLVSIGICKLFNSK